MSWWFLSDAGGAVDGIDEVVAAHLGNSTIVAGDHCLMKIVSTAVFSVVIHAVSAAACE